MTSKEEVVRPSACKRMQAGLHAVRAWPLWELPRWLTVFIFAVTGGYVIAVAVAAWTASASLLDVLVYGALLLCIAATVELTRRSGENAGLIKDVFAVWELPIAILLPPLFALLAPLVQLTLTQWRIRRIAPHKRAFSTAAVGLSYGLASVVFHQIVQNPIGPGPTTRAHVSVWLLAVAAAGVLQWASNQALVLPAVKASDPCLRVRDMLFAHERVHNDVIELCVAILVTLGTAFTPLAIIFAFPFVTLLQRSGRHAQLVNESRIDSKTGLLNAGTWEREAASEIARALRTRTPLALVLVDVDHFKRVNDVYGHLAGDKALRAIAHTFQIFLRDYDLAGRFGGEEFALLLPQTNSIDARQIAERVRVHIAGMSIQVDDDPGAGPFQVTVSIGVAALGSTWDRTTGNQLPDLLAGADRALYQAKSEGRNHVVMVTDGETVGAVASPAQLPGLSGLLPRQSALLPGKAMSTPAQPGFTGRNDWT